MTRQYLTGGDRSVSHFCLPVSSGGLERQLQALALTAFVGQRLITFISKEHYSGLERLVEMIEAGRLTPSVGQRTTSTKCPTPSVTSKTAKRGGSWPSASDRSWRQGVLTHAGLANYADYATLFVLIVAVPSVVGEFWMAIWLLHNGGKELAASR